MKKVHVYVYHTGASDHKKADFYLCDAILARVLAVILSDDLSVIPWHCVKTAKGRIMQTKARVSPGTRFLTPTVVGGRPPILPEICAKSDPPPYKHNNFNQYLLIALQLGELAKKVQLVLIGSRLCAVQQAIDEPCTLTLSPPEGGTKHDFAVFASKIQRISKEVCYRVSLCQNFQWQSCRYVIALSIGP